MNHIQQHNRGYIGDLTFNRVMTVSGQNTPVSAWAATLGPLVRTKFTVGNHTHWYFTKTVRTHTSIIRCVCQGFFMF